MRNPRGKKTGNGGVKPVVPAVDRKKKVKEIKETYDSGEYLVKPEKVADRMIGDAVRRIRSRMH